MPRLRLMLAAVVGLSMAFAAPVRAADTAKYTIDTLGIGAFVTDVRYDATGALLPGTYQASYFTAFHGTWTADKVTYLEDTVIDAGYYQFTVDEAGNVTYDFAFSGQAVPVTFAVDDKLASGHVVASIPMSGCAGCTLELDVTAAGFGGLRNDPSNAVGSGRWGGVPGVARIAYGGVGVTRAAELSGTVTCYGFDCHGVLAPSVATWNPAELSRGMGVEIHVFN